MVREQRLEAVLAGGPESDLVDRAPAKRDGGVVAVVNDMCPIMMGMFGTQFGSVTLVLAVDSVLSFVIAR